MNNFSLPKDFRDGHSAHSSFSEVVVTGGRVHGQIWALWSPQHGGHCGFTALWYQCSCHIILFLHEVCGKSLIPAKETPKNRKAIAFLFQVCDHSAGVLSIALLYKCWSPCVRIHHTSQTSSERLWFVQSIHQHMYIHLTRAAVRNHRGGACSLPDRVPLPPWPKVTGDIISPFPCSLSCRDEWIGSTLRLPAHSQTEA